MSDYEYDAGASRLVLSEGLDHDDVHLVMVSAEHLEGGTITVPVPDEDAPALALAILEAAGSSPFLADAVSIAYGYLHQHVDARAKEAEAKAEDAKVRAWWDETRYGHTTSLCWAHMGESAHEDVRKQYHLARKFFEGQA